VPAGIRQGGTMYYGYHSLGADGDDLLCSKLRNIVSNLPARDGKRPYIEKTDGAVLVRKLTNLTEDELKTFVEQADTIHDQVCIKLGVESK